MPKVSLSGMTVEALMDLRNRVDEMLHQRRAELEKQLKRFVLVGGARVGRGRGSALRGPSGETWAGRGAKPRLACCCDQRWKETRRFLDREVITEGAKKSQIEALRLRAANALGLH